MEIQITEMKGVTVVVLSGDLDMAAANELQHSLGDLIDNGHLKLVVDLDGVGYIDSSGLGTLVRATKEARAAGGELRVCALQDQVHSMFELIHLTNLVAIHVSRQEAVASWG